MTEADPEEEARVRRAIGGAREALIAALKPLAMPPGSRDARVRRDLTRADPHWLTDEQQDELQRLAWRHRRRLPRHLVPRMNPDDPIVREREMTDG